MDIQALYLVSTYVYNTISEISGVEFAASNYSPNICALLFNQSCHFGWSVHIAFANN